MSPVHALNAFMLISLHGVFAFSNYAAQRLPLGGSLFQVEARGLFPRQNNDLGSDCGGDPGCSTTGWGCQCGFVDDSWMDPLPTNVPGKNGVPSCAYVIFGNEQACINADYCNCGGTPAPLLTSTEGSETKTHCNYETVPTSECPPPTKAPEPTQTPEPEQKPPKEWGRLNCSFEAPGVYAKFSRDKAKEQIHNLCQAYVDDEVVLSESGSSWTNSSKYYELEQVKGSSEGDSTLIININWTRSGCANVNEPTDVNFKDMGVEKCELYILRAVDGCGEFENPNGDEYWKLGGLNQDACCFWSIEAQYDEIRDQGSD